MQAAPFPEEIDYIREEWAVQFCHVFDFTLDPLIREAVRAG